MDSYNEIILSDDDSYDSEKNKGKKITLPRSQKKEQFLLKRISKISLKRKNQDKYMRVMITMLVH